MENNCKNCGAILANHYKYCPICSQRTPTKQLNMHDVWHDLFHAFTHTDKGFLFLIKSLLLRPGVVAKEFVEGRRKKYMSPFSFLVIVVGVASIILIWSDFARFNAGNVKANAVSDFFDKHINLIIFFNVPVLAFFNWLFFKQSRKTYAENLVLAAYASGQRSVIFTLVIGPLWMIIHQQFWLFLGIYIFCWVVYFSWATRQFFGVSFWKGTLLGVLTAILTQLVTSAIVGLTYFIYFRFFFKYA